MNIKDNKLLHYVLIILLMIAPLRGVIAVPCDMQEMNASSRATVMPGTVMSDSVMPAHDMSAMLSTDSMSSGMIEHGCCDDSTVNCSADCDLGINFSLISQETSYSPVFNNSFKSVSFSSKILFRELTPPSRPPANLHS